MSSREFQEWRALDTLEPVDPERRADVRLAALMAHVANIMLGKNKQTGEPWRIDEFLLTWGDETDEDAERERASAKMLQIAQLMTARAQAHADTDRGYTTQER